MPTHSLALDVLLLTLLGLVVCVGRDLRERIYGAACVVIGALMLAVMAVWPELME